MSVYIMKMLAICPKKKILVVIFVVNGGSQRQHILSGIKTKKQIQIDKIQRINCKNWNHKSRFRTHDIDYC